MWARAAEKPSSSRSRADSSGLHMARVPDVGAPAPCVQLTGSLTAGCTGGETEAQHPQGSHPASGSQPHLPHLRQVTQRLGDSLRHTTTSRQGPASEPCPRQLWGSARGVGQGEDGLASRCMPR